MSFLGHAALRDGDYSGSIRQESYIPLGGLQLGDASHPGLSIGVRGAENSLARRRGGHQSLNSCGSSMLRNGGDPSITSHIVAPTDQMSTT